MRGGWGWVWGYWWAANRRKGEMPTFTVPGITGVGPGAGVFPDEPPPGGMPPMGGTDGLPGVPPWSVFPSIAPVHPTVARTAASAQERRPAPARLPVSREIVIRASRPRTPRVAVQVPMLLARTDRICWSDLTTQCTRRALPRHDTRSGRRTLNATGPRRCWGQGRRNSHA